MGIQRGTAAEPTASSNVSDPLTEKFGQLHVLDDLIRLRAADSVQYPILAYPSSDSHAALYNYYTGEQLDEMIDQAVSTLMEDGFRPPKKDGCVVALLTLSDLSMVITLFALSRLGYTVMILSPRLSGDACVSLLDTVGCENIIYGKTGTIRTTMGEILQRKLITCRPIPALSDSITETSLLVLHRNRNSEAQRNKIALILHSSGSTGNPKPMFLTHRALMTHPLRGPGLTSFNSLPWYHLHGISTALQAMWMRKTAFMWNAALPLTADSVVSALQEAKPEYVAAVPYMLQILIDDPHGIEALRKCKVVGYGGAPCPDELGDRLVREGVPFGGSFGLTEAGLVAESLSRPKDDPYWNYMKFFENLLPHIWMKPLGDSLYECVYLAGHPALTASNSNEPPGSYHSKDVFTPHPTIPNRWKYASRLDDRLTLINGEKVLPLPIEGCIKQHPLIHEAVVFGAGKTAPGLLIFRSQEANEASLSDEECFDNIWPSIESANSRAEKFSRIAKDMVAVLPSTSTFPRTDKGSMIRAQVYLHYNELIESIYASAEGQEGGTRVSFDETLSLLTDLCQNELGISLSGAEANFFSEGVDSLKAIHLRRLILQNFDLPKESLPQNVVYDTGSISLLSEYICAVQSGEDLCMVDDDNVVMSKLIQKYSSFEQHMPTGSSLTTKGVILTGATGSIGAHTLYELLNDDSVSTVFCLTRRKSPLEDVLASLIERELHITPEQASKIIALTSSLDEPDFGLSEELITRMRKSVTQILHVAWPVNFNIPLSQFEPHIRGLYNLLQFSLSVEQPQPAVVMFCSSVSTTLASTSTEIPESPADLGMAYMGYGQSKLIGEHIVSVAHKSGARAYSLRIGQVSGHSKKGLWNDTEALPLMVRSALVLKALPSLKETCSWLPVDNLAATILELTRSRSGSNTESEKKCLSADQGDDSIYNVCNSREFSWDALLASLGRNFQFDVVPFESWLQLLRESEARGEEHINPAVKLIDHYEAMFGSDSSAGRALGPKTFVTDKAERDSVTLQNGRLRIIEDGILDCYIRDWTSRWMMS
ncbi:AMP-dependent synthetase/ligase [Penicillium longicatenatum]|uniref:AMP-dependent synthetase/ligase n=1 Tax=Penicillium longicatenatum TaxID=1561947 RepID=UPI0025492537|nr:AMP-dependent synthetase/ligase [Penicillium longicatenatum]KAJ5630895.1 AMP-dependent synthetase/ligase [Penicillium longicatenatum]